MDDVLRGVVDLWCRSVYGCILCDDVRHCITAGKKIFVFLQQFTSQININTIKKFKELEKPQKRAVS
jgi:hypothetical protein